MTHVTLRFFAFLITALALLPLGARAFCYPDSVPPPFPIYEYVNDVTGHYVLWSSAQDAIVDARSGTRWHRTGHVFGGVSFVSTCSPFFPPPPTGSLCTFYAPSIDAYFQTARPAECGGLGAHPESGWISAGGMQVSVPDSGGACVRGTTGVRRYYSGASTASGVSHRHTSDPNVALWLLAQGWIHEGLDFCSIDVLLVRQNIYEYVNDSTRHYVLLWNPDEIGTIDAGSARTGWHPTGYVFGGFNTKANFVPGVPLCRFYAPSINAHFLTARDVECEGLRAVPASGWIYERNDVSVQIPDVPGQCAVGLIPVYRFHSDTLTASGVGYRHTADASIRATLLAEGWTDEGIAFCAASYSTPQ